MCKGGTELEYGRIPLLEKEGWLRPKEISRSHLSGSGRGGWISRQVSTTPSAPLRNGAISSWRSHPYFSRRGMRPYSNSVPPLHIPIHSHSARHRFALYEAPH